MSTSASPTTPSRHTAVLRATLAAVLGLATALIVWHPNWIEVLGLGDPDHGSGAVERLLVLVLAVATTLTTLAARSAPRINREAVETWPVRGPKTAELQSSTGVERA